MDRTPASLDDADRIIRGTDYRAPGRILADLLHAAGYLVPGRLDGVDDQRAYSARVVRDGLALLALAGGTAADVGRAAVLTDLYRRDSDHPQPVGKRAASGGDVFSDYPDDEPHGVNVATRRVDVELIPDPVADIRAATARFDADVRAAASYPYGRPLTLDDGTVISNTVPAGTDRHA